MKRLALAAVAVAALTLPAFAYDPTSWHLPGYQPGDEGQHTAAYDALHGSGHVPAPPHVTPPPHVLTARENAYILCVTGREPADFDFDGTCHQITKNNQNGAAVQQGKITEFIDANGYHWTFYNGTGLAEASKGGVTWSYDHGHLTNTCSGWFC